MTDTELLDWFEDKGAIVCAALINDDNGHWAVSTTGMQNVIVGDGLGDVQTTFFIEAADWKRSVREAILAFKDQYESY
jgi:hypothetical protein